MIVSSCIHFLENDIAVEKFHCIHTNIHSPYPLLHWWATQLLWKVQLYTWLCMCISTMLTQNLSDKYPGVTVAGSYGRLRVTFLETSKLLSIVVEFLHILSIGSPFVCGLDSTGAEREWHTISFMLTGHLYYTLSETSVNHWLIYWLNFGLLFHF